MELKTKGEDYEPSIYELGSLYEVYSRAIEGINNERDSCIRLLKDKYQSERASQGRAVLNEWSRTTL